VVHRVEGLQIYHYAVQNHKLELMRTGDFRTAVVTSGLGAETSWDGQCLLLNSLDDFQRTTLEVPRAHLPIWPLMGGTLGQNLCPASLGLSACAVGGFDIALA